MIPPSPQAQSIGPWQGAAPAAAPRTDAKAGAAASTTQQSTPKPFTRGTIYEIRGWRYWCVLLPVALLLRLYYATLRIEMDEEDERALSDTSRPVLFTVWHNRSFIVPMIIARLRKPERFTCMISPSKVAAWEAGFFKIMGIRSERGSSSRRSIQATRDLLKAYRSGYDIGISPDGPTGPCYEFKRGATMMARLSGAPMLLVGAESRTAWRPHTWDRHFIPLPFSKVRLHGRILETSEVFQGGRDDVAAAAFVAQRLREVSPDRF